MKQINIPGVYSKIDASAAVSSGPPVKVIGIVAKGTSDDTEHKLTNVAYAPFSFKDTQAKYGEDSPISKIVKVCSENGGSRYIIVRVDEKSGEADYQKALDVIALEEAIDIIITDLDDGTKHSLFKEHCKITSDDRKERIAILGFEAGLDVDAATTIAKDLNSGLIFMPYPNVLDINGNELSGVYTAAALAGQIAGESDPSMPMTNVPIRGFHGLAEKLTDEELNVLITSGIVPLQIRSGDIRVVRAVSTYTMGDNNQLDKTWQEITTVLVTHHIFKDLRNRLTTRFSRAKQTAETREAIKSEILTALLEYESLDYIEDVSPESINVSVNPTDPFRNDVEFVYNVTGPVNTIFLTGHLVI